MSSALAATIYHHDHPIHAWSVSAKVSADRVLAIVAVLKTLSLAEGSYISLILPYLLLNQLV
jgi:hypothetical protein